MKKQNLFFTFFAFLLCMASSTLAHGALVVTNPSITPTPVLAGALVTITNSVTGGTAPYTWSVSSGSLGSLVLNNSTGGISGMPSAPGSIDVTLKIQDSSTPLKQSVYKRIQFSVIPDVPNLPIATLPNAKVGVSYSYTFNATGGKTPYTWSTASALPGNVTLSSAGVLSGTPTQAAAPTTTTVYPINVKATGTNNQTASRIYNLSVAPSDPPTITTKTLSPDAELGGEYYAEITATGGKTPYKFASASIMPSGLIVKEDGTVTGKPTVAGTFRFLVKVTGSDTRFSTAYVSVNVTDAPAPKITSVSPFNGVIDTPFTSVLQATGGTLPYIWSKLGATTDLARNLPAGLTLSANGSIVGTPTVSGTFSVPFRVTDANGKGNTKILIIAISSGALSVKTQTIPSTNTGIAYTTKLVADGGFPSYTWTLKNRGTLPSTLTLSPVGVVSGVANAPGNYSFTAQVSDSVNATATKDFILNVVPYDLAITTSSPLPAGTAGANYTTALTATGGKPPYTWSFTSTPALTGVTPSGGNLKGRPASAGNYSILLKVTDSNAKSANATVTLRIIDTDPLAFDAASLPNGKVGDAYVGSIAVKGGYGPYTISRLSSTPLPAGLLMSSSGAITGKPTLGGNFTFTVNATDSKKPTATTISQNFTIRITPYDMVVIGDTAIAATRYQAFTPRQFSAMGGKAPYTWSPATPLPLNLQLNSTTGFLTGNVTAVAGNYTTTIKVVDGNKQAATRNCTIFITNLPVSWSTNATLPSAKIGVPYTGGNLTAAGGKSPYTYSIKAGSTLPGNLTLTTSGKIVGTPTTAGTYTFTLIVKDSQSPQQTAERVFNLVVRSDDTDMVTVLGGISAKASNFPDQPVQTFQMGRFEVTWEEWQKVRTYAIPKFYDLTAIGTGAAATHPVTNVSWYDVLKWCNAKSEMDGLTPVYTVNGAVYKTGQSVPSIDASANGYRLPSESEWEWAARGGGLNNGCVYSGSNTANDVAWTYENSSDGTKAVGTKAANELGIYDMSGNVWEWCWDVLYDYGTSYRRIRGGCWYYGANDAAVAVRANNFYPADRSFYFGFRLARSSGN